MAINKKLLHFKKFSDFNSKKLSANEANTQYTVGVSGAIQNGTPDVLYQSICWIKDTKQQWTHGQLYDFSNDDAESTPKLVLENISVADLEQVVTSGEQTLIFGDTGDLAYYLNHNYPIYIKYDAYYEYPSLFQVYGFFDGDQYYLYTLVGNQQYTIEIYTSTTPCYVERSTIPYSLKTVNGESIIGEGNIQIAGGDEPYITTCTVGDLRNLAYGVVDRIALDPRGIAGALSENKRVLMPYSTTSSNGYYSVVGRSQGDILYLTVVSNAEAFDIQTPLNYQDLYTGNITRLVIPSENQLGNAAIHQLAFDFLMVYDVFEEGQYEVNSEDYGTFFDTADVGIIAEKIRTEGNVVVAVVDDHNGYQLLPATVWFDEQGAAEFNILVYSPYSKYWYEILMNLQSGYQSIKRYKNYIEGGSSAYPQIDAGLDGDTFDIFPNTFYVFGEKTDLDITFIDAESSGNGGKACEYLFQFTSGSEGTTLVLNDDIKWASELVIEPNKIYQISILNGLGTVMSWDNAPNLTENHITYNEGDFMNGGTIIFEYPTASELTFTMAHYSSPELVIEEGTTQVSIDWFEPLAPVIQSISPDRDSTYIYIY